MPTPEKTTHRSSTNRERQSKAHSPRVWRFEQLESRAMLSATMGSSFSGTADHAMGMHGYGEPQAPQAGIFAPENFRMRMDGSPKSDDRIGGPPPGGRHVDFDRMPLRFGLGPAMWGYDNPAPAHSALTSPNNQPASTATAGTSNAPTNAYFGSDVIIIFKPITYLAPPPPINLPPADGTQHFDPPGGGAISALFNGDPIGAREYNTAGKVVSGSSLPYGSAITSSISTPSAPHGIELSTLMSNGALEAALQSYTSQLLLVTGNINCQPMVANTLNDQSVSAADEADDFVRLSDFATTSDKASHADALSRQQAAIEEVLGSLQGDESLPSESIETMDEQNESVSGEQDGQVADFVFGTAYDVAEMDGGMVLLQATGDANESPVTLARVAESHPDMFSPHIGVEASIGFYQAVDRGIEELSAPDTSPPTNSANSPVLARPVNRILSNEGGSSRNAAGIVAASTLAGGLLWVAGHKHADERKSETAANRRSPV